MPFYDGFDEIVIKWASATSLTASVRDRVGIHDCTFTADGWSCAAARNHTGAATCSA
jgi:hypothetical protein